MANLLPRSALVRRLSAVAASLALAALIPVAVAAASSSSSSAPALQLHKTKLGSILVDHRGFTVYAFSTDKPNFDSCVKVTNCLKFWPPVKPGHGALAGRGVKRSLIGTITLKHGVKQLTYNGFPLYTYTQDTRPAETKFVNLFQFQGFWPALNAAGKIIK